MINAGGLDSWLLESMVGIALGCDIYTFLPSFSFAVARFIHGKRSQNNTKIKFTIYLPSAHVQAGNNLKILLYIR